jgi:hypothetical protein
MDRNEISLARVSSLSLTDRARGAAVKSHELLFVYQFSRLEGYLKIGAHEVEKGSTDSVAEVTLTSG